MCAFTPHCPRFLCFMQIANKHPEAISVAHAKTMESGDGNGVPMGDGGGHLQAQLEFMVQSTSVRGSTWTRLQEGRTGQVTNSLWAASGQAASGSRRQSHHPHGMVSEQVVSRAVQELGALSALVLVRCGGLKLCALTRACCRCRCRPRCIFATQAGQGHWGHNHFFPGSTGTKAQSDGYCCPTTGSLESLEYKSRRLLFTPRKAAAMGQGTT